VGEGSDELFWGYPNWKTLWNLQRYANLPLPKALKRLGLAALRASGRSESYQYELLRRAAADMPIFWGGAEAFTEAQKRHLLSPRLQRQFSNYTSWEAISPIRERFLNKAWEKSTLHWMSFLDLNLRLPELLLMRVDKMSMGVSLEARVPFLDHKFVELAMSIPESVKTKNGTLKYILKKSIAGILPDDLIHRKKQGFGVPVYEWLFDRLGSFIRQQMDGFLERTDFLDRDAAMQLVDNRRGREAWVLLNFVMWWTHFIEQTSTSESHCDPVPQTAIGGR
jgi:asparagine synthase (glutamine-hydrolysing)